MVQADGSRSNDRQKNRFRWRKQQSPVNGGSQESTPQVVIRQAKARERHGGTPTPKAQISSRRVPERALRKRRYCLKACLDELERVRKERDDPILRGNALADAKGHLQALWELLEGVPDAEALEEMVNVLQIALCLDGPEPPPIEQLDAISSVLAKMHDDPDVSDQIANELTQELIEGGVDVFREIG